MQKVCREVEMGSSSRKTTIAKDDLLMHKLEKDSDFDPNEKTFFCNAPETISDQWNLGEENRAWVRLI